MATVDLTNEEIKDRVLENYDSILANFDPKGHVLHTLFGKKIIALSQMKHITNLSDAEKRADALMQILFQDANEAAFVEFRKALERNDGYRKRLIDNHVPVSKNLSGSVQKNDSNLSNDQIMEIVQEKMAEISANFDPKGSVLNFLVKRGIINFPELKSLNNESHDTRGYSLLTLLLGGAHQSAFVVFRESLKRDHGYRVNIIDQAAAAKGIVDQPLAQPSAQPPAQPPVVPPTGAPVPDFDDVDGPDLPNFAQLPAEMKIEFKHVTDQIRMKAKGTAGGERVAIIINNKNFTSSTVSLKIRSGAEHDSTNLTNLLQKLKFTVNVCHDKTAQEMSTIFDQVSQLEQLDNCECFLLFLLSHGEEGSIFGSDGNIIKIREIQNYFSGSQCPKLKNKPKLIFIQACQVPKHIELDSSDETLEEALHSICNDNKGGSNIVSSGVVAMPQCDDMINMMVTYAVNTGYPALRNTYLGSLFVRCLVDVMVERAHEDDLYTMLTSVTKNLVAMNNAIRGNPKYKQLARVESYMTESVYLLPPE